MSEIHEIEALRKENSFLGWLCDHKDRRYHAMLALVLELMDCGLTSEQRDRLVELRCGLRLRSGFAPAGPRTVAEIMGLP